MADRARVEQSVFDYLKPQLKQYASQNADLARDVARSIAKVSQEADDKVTERRRALARAIDDLESCLAKSAEDEERGGSGADCGGYRRQVEIRKSELDRSIKGRAMIAEAEARFRHAQSRHSAKVDQVILDGQKLLRTATERTEGYQKSSTYVPTTTLLSGVGSSGGSGFVGSSSSGGASSGGLSNGGLSSAVHDVETTPTASWRDQPGVHAPGWLPSGYGLIPLDLIADDGSVTSAASFNDNPNKHPLSDLRWASNALDEVVLPAMQRMPDPLDYFERRDAAEGLSGARSYAQTYRGFFGTDAIALSPLPNGTFDVTNGYHRLWLLRQNYAGHAPARIIGG